MAATTCNNMCDVRSASHTVSVEQRPRETVARPDKRSAEPTHFANALTIVPHHPLSAQAQSHRERERVRRERERGRRTREEKERREKERGTTQKKPSECRSGAQTRTNSQQTNPQFR